MNCFAYLKASSPFYEVTTGHRVPLVSPEVQVVECEGDGPPQLVYMVDVNRLDAADLIRILELLHKRSPAYTPELIREEILDRGLPVRHKHVASVSMDTRAFL